MVEELHRARSICRDGNARVSALFDDARHRRAVDAESMLPLVAEIIHSVVRHPDALLSLVRLKTHDDQHSVAVCVLMVVLARRIGLSDEQVLDAGTAGILHDLGKEAIPLGLLHKPDALSNDELRCIRAHPQRGYDMLRASGIASETVLDVVLHHHEKLDGSGYPQGLRNEAISLMARMGAVCDVYDAITSIRSYKRACSPAESLRLMASWEGHLDASVLRAFVLCIGIYPVGELVRLESDCLGVVLEQGEDSPLTPLVRVFFDARTRESVPLKDIDLAASDCADRIVGLEPAEVWSFPHLDRLWLTS